MMTSNSQGGSDTDAEAGADTGADELASPEEAQEEQQAAAEPEGDAAPEGPSRSREEELTDQLKRLAADYANYQKRVQRDKAKWTQDAIRGLLQDLLPVIDNLDQAIGAFEGEVKDPQVYRQGVVLVRDELMRQLGHYQVERIEAADGTPFDPDLHEAILVQEAEGIDQQQVAFCARSGYRLGETVLRPAQVGVKKPKSA